MRDGLGFEEVNQSGLSTVLAQAVSGIYTRALAENIIGTTDVSGLDVFAQGSGTFGRVTDRDGAMFSISVDSGTTGTFGPKIQVGSCITTSVGFGSAIFNTQFTNEDYFFTAQIGSTGTFLAAEAGSWNITISGTLGRNVSGVTFKGAQSSPYTWVAIGL